MGERQASTVGEGKRCFIVLQRHGGSKDGRMESAVGGIEANLPPGTVQVL